MTDHVGVVVGHVDSRNQIDGGRRRRKGQRVGGAKEENQMKFYISVNLIPTPIYFGTVKAT